VKARSLVLAAYGYSALDIFAWWARLSSNGHQSWVPLLDVVCFVFMPLDFMVLAVCRAVWGTSSVIEANTVVGLMADIALASVLSTTLLLVPLLAVTRRKERIVPTGSAFE
jgi:hypothetical protein